MKRVSGARAAGSPAVTAGVDIVSVVRIEDMLRRWGERFLKRLFTDQEIGYCMARAFPARSLAARFAAKEAFFKAVAAWYRGGMDHKSIEVVTTEAGVPAIRPHGKASRALGNRATSLSLSHEREFAVALVVTSAGAAGAASRGSAARELGRTTRRARGAGPRRPR